MEPLITAEVCRAQRAGAVGLLRRAFDDDPIFRHFFPNQADRVRALDICMDDALRGAVRRGGAWLALDGDDILGAAIWAPPGEFTPGLADRLRWRLTRRRIRNISADAEQGMWRGFTAAGALHPLEPHWYLLFVAVKEKLRGRGIGQSLLQPVHALADARRTPCYLETPNPRNHGFYRRLGYEIREQARPFRDAPPVWTMFRAPLEHQAERVFDDGLEHRQPLGAERSIHGAVVH